MLVARERQLCFQLGFVKTLALREGERIGREKRRGRHAIERRRRRHDENVAASFAEIVQRREPLRHEILVRRKRVVRQRFPVRQEPHAGVRREVGQFDREALRIDSARADYRQKRHGLAMRGEIARDGERIGGAGSAVEDETLSCLDERDGGSGLRVDGFRRHKVCIEPPALPLDSRAPDVVAKDLL
ncbi:hypothetical protein BURKHO8Y_170379 [Burkholderia sp. 8Y]|nr:hypothetical protein BURKHO8Y_170379 [Burkholderia sp. 8Y]